jgi:transposase
MLRMEKVHVIRHKVLVEGQPIRQVALEMRVSRKTIRKYLKVSEPKRVETNPRARPVYELVVGRIEEILREWGPRTTRKQRLTGARLHQQLVEEGYSVGISLVREYLRELRRQSAEVFIPLVHRPGEEAQVDFFEVTVELGGVMRKAWKFLMRLMYSGRDFVRIYERCDQLSFLDAHVRGLSYFGGVPRRIIYDNLSAAVKRRVGIKVELTERFRALVSHYLFEPCFARPGEGHDKGGVEGRGRGIRLRHLTPVPRGESLAELSEHLIADIEKDAATRKDVNGRTVLDRFGEDSERFRALPETGFEARRSVPVSVNRKAQVTIDGAVYSVSSTWAGLTAMALVGVEDIHITLHGESVTYPVSEKGTRVVRYRHYLRELSRKPQAVRQVAPELLSELGKPYGQLWELLVERYGELEAARVLARLLGAVSDKGPEAMACALETFLREGHPRLPREEAVPTAPVHVPAGLAGHQVLMRQAREYDVLLLGGGAA